MATNYKLIKQLLSDLIVDFSHVNRQIVEAYTKSETSGRFKKEELQHAVDQMEQSSRKMMVTIGTIRKELNAPEG